MYYLPLHLLFNELQELGDSIIFRAGEPGMWCAYEFYLKP